jgi:UDP-glucuronate 4-epimerase
MQNTILITGVGGFIGFSVAKYLIKKKYKIIGVDNLNNYYNQKLKNIRIQELKCKKFQFLKIDLRKNSQIIKQLKKIKFNLILHFAAQPGVRYSIIDPKSYIENNIMAFSNILELARSKKIKLIYSSSSSVYGETNIYPINENAKLNPKNMYAITKKNNEEQAEIYSKNYGLSIIGLRFFTVFGEWGRPDMLILKFLIAAKNGLKFYLYNHGNHYRDFTYIKDLIRMIYPLIKNYKKMKKDHKIFNICSGKPIHIVKIIAILKKLTGYKKIVNTKKSTLEVYKTHGSKKKLEKFLNMKFKNTNIDLSIINLFNWFKKKEKLFS